MFTYIIIGFIVLGALIGYNKGFLKQISSLLGLIIGYLVATLFLSQTHQFFIDKGILSAVSSTRLSFFLTVGVVIFSVKFLSGVIENGLKAIGLGFTNQWGGMIFGAVKYFLIVMILCCFLSMLGIISEKNSSENLLNFISLFKTVLVSYI